MRARKHKWIGSDGPGVPFDHYICSVCGERSDCPADPCDSDRIKRWMDKLLKRTDCSGHKPKPIKNKVKAGDIYISPSNRWWP